MGSLSKNYEVLKDGPKELEWDCYYSSVMEEYKNLLEKNGDDESVFQHFFENNPAMIPGGLELFGQSGHYPFMNALITQPTIGIAFERQPDFVWLAQDSLCFCPVLVEIERPNKKMFTKSNLPSADFNQALNQIDEWKMILNKAENQIAFYEYYNIPQEIRSKTFTPQYLLIYGRRSEYENDEYLRNLRSQKQRENVAIMSFDRLRPLADYKQFITCKVKNKNYEVLSIPPTFRYIAGEREVLCKWKNFVEKIEQMQKTTEDRKNFLIERYSYWTSFKGNPQGLIVGMEGE